VSKIKNKSINFLKTQNQSNKSNPNFLLISGKHPVLTILLKKRRKVIQILVTKNSEAMLQEFLTKHDMSLQYQPLIKLVTNEYLNVLLKEDQLHQGIAINCAYLSMQNQNDFLNEIANLKSNFLSENKKAVLPPILIMDQLQDPHNIGAIIRSAVAFGVKKIVFLAHNFPKENATMAKSSSGMMEMVDLIMVTNLNNFIEKLKDLGYWCIGLDGSAKISINEINDYDNIALIIGSEGEGIRQLVKKNCDILAKINLNPEVESLNASTALAITLYQLFGKNIF
jgi:23S rRNA (guanosine2251-2'-O)-methyltransferase